MVALRQGEAEPITYAGALTKDATLRMKFFGESVMAHPAKQHLPQLIHLLQRFGVRGGVLVDPMGGSGSAMLATAPIYGGMHVVTNELAPHFIALQAGAWAHFQTALPMLNDVKRTPPGEYVQLQGDSRQLAQVLLDEGADMSMADLIITSPSYGGSEAVDRRKKQNDTIGHHGGGNTAREGYYGNGELRSGSTPHAGKGCSLNYDLIPRLGAELRTHGLSPNSQLSSKMMGYDQIPRMKDNGMHARHGFGPHSQLSAKSLGYIEPIANLVISSPPYHDTLSSGKVGKALQHAHEEGFGGPNSQVTIPSRYSPSPQNIGNLRGTKYLDSMAQVWQQCAVIMKPGAVLCCITRDCVTKGQRVPVGEQNRQLLMAAGLNLQEVEVWSIPTMSFWRNIQHQKYPDSPIINTEEVSVFIKP